jgi:isopenicillin-N N-acyltransferase-like protein
MKFANKFIPHIEEVAPHLVEEMKGIAEGAEIPVEEVYFLNIRGEVGRRKIMTQCTTFGLLGTETSDEEIMLGQTIDSPAGSEKSLLMLRLIPKKGPKILTCVRAGTVAYIGINSYGVGKVGNGLSSSDYREYGVPRVIVDRLLLEQESIDGIISEIKRINRTYSTNMMFGDSTGRIVNIETTPLREGILEPKGGFIGHANHYEHPDLLKYDVRPNISRERSTRIKELISIEKRPIIEETAKNWMKDHRAPICRHISKNEGELGIKTLVSTIMRPSKNLMHVCWGNPCQNEYHEYNL